MALEWVVSLGSGRFRRRFRIDVIDWSGLGINEAARLTQDRQKWRKCIHSVTDRPLEDGIGT